MFLCKRIELSNEKERIGSEILNWSLGNERFLNVVSLPYNLSEIFIKVILNYVNSGKRVIYITNEEENRVNILNAIKKYSDFRGYTYIRKLNSNIKARLKVCSCKSVLEIKEKFDLIIYDEIRSFPVLNKYEILELMTRVSEEETKFIVYSIESLFRNKREIVLPVKNDRIPMVEPRTILTRIDINKDIPFVVYDYLKWSIISNRRVIIYAPSEEKIKNIYRYINNYCSDFTKNIMCCEKDKKDKKQIANFEKMKRAVLITNDFQQTFSDIKNTDVMVYFANDPEYDYKKLIYFCGNVGRSERDSKGEVIFLANEETEEMERAKNIMRNFNKEAWEMGLLRI